MLQGCKEGRNKSWAIRFCFNQFLQNKLSVFPVKSLVANNGFDGEGTNCRKYSRFKFELECSDKKHFNFPVKPEIVGSIHRQTMYYHSVFKRLWSRIMYLIYR